MIRVSNLSLFFFLFFYFPANAHYYSESFSKWDINHDQVSGNFNVLEIEATRVLQIEKYQELALQNNLSEKMVFKNYLDDHILVRSQGKNCTLIESSKFTSSKIGFLNIEMNFQCPSNKNIQIINNALFDLVQSHVHISRVYENNEILIEKALFYNDQTIVIENNKIDLEFQFFKNFYNFLKTGISHILNGFDHLLFIIGLLILTQSLRNLLLIITGFTIGHSTTLTLAALQIMVPNSILIESMIGFTIMFIGAEYLVQKTNKYLVVNAFFFLLIISLLISKIILNIDIPSFAMLGLLIFSIGYFALHRSLSRKDSLLIIITILFGLIHGFGFGSYLVTTGINSTNLVTALLGFNLGVEIGQILFVLCLLTIIAVFYQFGFLKIINFLKNSAFILVVSMGFFWFVQRLVS